MLANKKKAAARTKVARKCGLFLACRKPTRMALPKRSTGSRAAFSGGSSLLKIVFGVEIGQQMMK